MLFADLQPGSSDDQVPGIKECLAADLEQWLATLQDDHDNLADDYDAAALAQIEAHIYDLGTNFNYMLNDDENLYKDWVNRSEKCRQQVEEIISKSDDAAYAFQEARETSYNRAHCRRCIQNLLIAIRNLDKLNDGRSE
jgi:hypothetical protein